MMDEARMFYGLLRTGGVSSIVLGTMAEVDAYVNDMNATDEQGTTEVVTSAMNAKEATDWLDEVTR
jgi:hypothetical protein